MTQEKVLEVVNYYRECFEGWETPKKKLSDSSFDELLFLSIPEDENAMLAHCHAMLDEIEKFARDGRTEKAYGWICFIQGCLWSNGEFALNELKNHNCPNDETAA